MTGSGPVVGGEDELRIIVADDQASVREGLVTILNLTPGIVVVASAANGQQALDLVAEHAPDAILLDLHMPVLDGIETAALLTARHRDVAIVVLTTYADDESILAALRAGARSYLTKNADRVDIAHALRSAVSGLSVLDPAVHAALLAAATDRGSPVSATPVAKRDLPDGLTVREGEILTLLASGLTNPEIAAQLVLSHHTIKTHLNHIFAKTGSRDRAAATTYAYVHNFLARP
jgi:DNA-binding NarL/FixJ family response regulator